MLGFYNYTVILTYLGMLTGFVGIVYTFNGNIRAALFCLMAAGICDMFDGKIASIMKRNLQEKRFGVQIDSLSDLISFGVLPALLVFAGGGSEKLRFIASALYLLCALIRLAWFNVEEEERQKRETDSRRFYRGLPVTSAALIFPVVMGMGIKQNEGNRLIIPWIMILTAVSFLMPFQLKKPALPGKIGILLLGILEIIFVAMAGMDM